MGGPLPERVCAVLSEAGGASLVRLLVVGTRGVHGRGGAGEDVLQAVEALVPLDLRSVVGFLSLAFPRGTQLVQRVLEVVEAALQVGGAGLDVVGGAIESGVIYLEIHLQSPVQISHSAPRICENELSVSASLDCIALSALLRLSASS